ncbi:MAG TPA: DEAD/DEAH box helicase, partial [Bacteroidia bacterium]|nr:DEAD/DEAH box helicase [Bacteroidia bacterium]
MTFSDLKLIKPLALALDNMGYTQPTPIQEQSIPHILLGKDIFGCAQTGTGKTAAFALPILQSLQNKSNPNSNKRTIKALVLAPTRELALQISNNFSSYSKNLNVTHTTVYGGVSMGMQIKD